MAGRRDYYDVLGVDPSASPEALKRAYRLRAVRVHPDQNVGPDAKEQFAELGEAYAVLSDPKRRSFFDKNGFVEFSLETARPEEALDDLFRPGSTARAKPAVTGRASAVESHLFAVFEADAPEAGIEFDRLVCCDACEGRGGNDLAPCSVCDSRGRTLLRKGLRSGMVSCSSCRGRGHVPTSRCESCAGAGSQRVKARVAVQRPTGLLPRVVRIDSAGDELNGKARGDLFVLVEARKRKPSSR